MEDAGRRRGLVNCMLEEDILAPHSTMMGPICTVKAAVVQILLVLGRGHDCDGHCGRDGVKVEEPSAVGERFELNAPSARGW